jgi:hypothetical protein
MRSTYWITIQTERAFTAQPTDPSSHDGYTHTAAQLVEVLHSLFADAASLATLTRCATLSAATTEVQVMQTDAAPESPVVAKVMFEADAVDRVALDKSRLSQAVRAKLNFAVKVTKRFVPQEEI